MKFAVGATCACVGVFAWTGRVVTKLFFCEINNTGAPWTRPVVRGSFVRCC